MLADPPSITAVASGLDSKCAAHLPSALFSAGLVLSTPMQALCSTATVDAPPEALPRTKLQKVVVLGGTGRVGGSTAEALLDK